MEIPKAIDKLRIVGSGTAGLIFATYFKKMVPDMEIEIYYDSKIKPLVVGESMQPYMRFFFEKVFEDESWMDKTNATYKFYIKHDGWANVPGSSEDSSMTFPLCDDRFDNIEECEREVFSATSSNLPSCSSRRAWQMQSVLLQPILIEKCEEMGIKLIDKHFDFDDTSEFVIDCRGFKGLEGGNISPLIINDTAIAGHVEHFGDTKGRYYTRTIAKDNGWAWEIPLQNKVGVGRVFCSRYNTEEEIKEQLLKTYGLKKTLTVPFATRYNTDACTSQSLKIGTSSVFIEPLEATTLLLVVYSCWLFKEMLKSFQFTIDKYFVEHYNKNYRRMVDQHVLFIESFYGLSNRVDSPYWQEIDKHRKAFRKKINKNWPEYYGNYIKKKVYEGFEFEPSGIGRYFIGQLPTNHLPRCGISLNNSSHLELEDTLICNGVITWEGGRFVMPSGKHLDMGCGDMPYKKDLMTENIVGIDNQKFPNVDIIGNLEDIKLWKTLSNDEFDCITSFGVLHWLGKRSEVWLKETYRVLKPGGKFYHYFWDMRNLYEPEICKFLSGMHPGNYPYWWKQCASSAKEKFERTGFKIILSESCRPKIIRRGLINKIKGTLKDPRPYFIRIVGEK